MRLIRTIMACILIVASIVFAILPGSIFLTLAGLVLLAIDYPKAKGLLRWTQKRAKQFAVVVDNLLRERKHR